MDKLPRIPSPPGVWLRELRIAVLPFVVFTVVLGLTIVTWQRYVGPSALVGEVEAIRAFVSSPQDGRIASLTVDVLDRVRAGQVIGEIEPADPRVVLSQLALGRTRVGYLRDTLDTQLRQQNTELSYVRLRMDWMDQRAELASLKAQQIYSRRELDRQERLAAGGSTNRLTSIAEYETARSNFESIAAQIEERTQVVEEIERAIERLIPEQAKLTEEGPDSLHKALAVEEKALSKLESLMGPVILVASTDGVVASVHRRVGENIVAGEPIVTLSADRAERVIGFVRQPITFEVRTNMMVEVRCRGRNRESGLGRILSVGTQLEPILPQLLPRGASSNMIEYGLPFLVSLPAGLPALGGESVDLVLLPE